MRELALILPDDVWLTNLTGTAQPRRLGQRRGQHRPAQHRSPARRWSWSAAPRSQDAVAGFVSALKDIDGVTRVGVQSSQLGGGAGGGKRHPAGGGSCQTHDFIAQFQIVAAFDAAPVPAAATGESEVAPAPRPKKPPESTETSTTECGRRMR